MGWLEFMKTLVPVLLAVALVAGTASAQNVGRLKQKARDLPGKMTERHNGAENGAPPPGPPPKPGTAQPPSTTPTAPQPAAAPIKPTTQQQAVAKLRADIAEVHTKGEATAELKKQFTRDLAAAAQGSGQPAAATVAKFGEGLLTALAAKNVSLADDAKLVKAIVVSLNSVGLSASRQQELNDEIQAVLTKAGVPAGEVSLAGQNLAAMVAEIQSSAAK